MHCFKHAWTETNTSLICFLCQINQRELQVKNKVCAVALTDSSHNIWLQETNKGTQDWMFQVNKAYKHSHFLKKINKMVIYLCVFPLFLLLDTSADPPTRHLHPSKPNPSIRSPENCYLFVLFYNQLSLFLLGISLWITEKVHPVKMCMYAALQAFCSDVLVW